MEKRPRRLGEVASKPRPSSPSAEVVIARNIVTKQSHGIATASATPRDARSLLIRVSPATTPHLIKKGQRKHIFLRQGEGYGREGHPEASAQGSAKRRASRGNKRISLICGAKQGGSKGDGPLGRRTKSEKGRQQAKRGLEGGRRSGFPLQKVAAGKFAGLRAHIPSLSRSGKRQIRTLRSAPGRRS